MKTIPSLSPSKSAPKSLDIFLDPPWIVIAFFFILIVPLWILSGAMVADFEINIFMIMAGAFVIGALSTVCGGAFWAVSRAAGSKQSFRFFFFIAMWFAAGASWVAEFMVGYTFDPPAEVTQSLFDPSSLEREIQNAGDVLYPWFSDPDSDGYALMQKIDREHSSETIRNSPVRRLISAAIAAELIWKNEQSLEAFEWTHALYPELTDPASRLTEIFAEMMRAPDAFDIADGFNSLIVGAYADTQFRQEIDQAVWKETAEDSRARAERYFPFVTDPNHPATRRMVEIDSRLRQMEHALYYSPEKTFILAAIASAERTPPR